MIRFPVKKLSFRTWLQIIGIWTFVSVSMGTQMYLNSKQGNPDAVWLNFVLKQLPTWFLCAMLTPVVMFFYEKFPLDTPEWKSNAIKQTATAIIILAFFAHPRLWAMSYIVNRDIRNISSDEYLNLYLSQMAWDWAIYVFIVAIFFADKANRKRKENELRNRELENQLNLAQLDALKWQLNPHFLFNTLNTVNSLIRTEQYPLAIQANARLGDFLRTTLYAEPRQFVSLQKEMEFLDLYLNIEFLRFRDRLKVKKDISRESLDIEVPYFILQPLVENAIKHGIAKQIEASLLSIRTFVESDYLTLNIYNEGELLPENWEISKSKGIGLMNVSTRLAKTYGENHTLEVCNHESLKGVLVTMKIPR
ncbi:Histidine kinase [Pseudarcicella hirudinis]|uniref:Histidine kinase n=1 Tax=Pseudarcicella hirudinis TaxID=1079859 RepID=A0A1I5V1K5_9BACT|nr:histidine kinase [Pseudarcicella hirudinis]SFQ01187.1 Histidine kinase [Pseudarcicella hirudinis]